MISVVVCTYNRAEILGRMLESFFAQGGLASCNYELIVVDNNSSDDTREVAKRFETCDGFCYVFEGRQGLSVARNRGVGEAGGEIVAFLDDDVIVDDNWLVNLQKCFDETGADAAGGRSYLILEQDPPDWLEGNLRLSLSEVDLGPERKAVAGGRGLYGLNMAFRKTRLEEVGKFDEGLGRRGKALLAGEETLVFKRIAEGGGTIVYEPDAVVGHIIERDRLTWDYFRRMSAGLGCTWALSEEPVRLMGRAKRLIESLHDVLIDGGRWGWAGVTRDDKTRRKAALHLLWTWGVLGVRVSKLVGRIG